MITALAILAAALGIIATWLMLVLIVAGAANSSPEQLARLKFWSITIATSAAFGLIGSIWLIIVDRPWAAVAVGASPALVCLIALLALLRAERTPRTNS